VPREEAAERSIAPCSAFAEAETIRLAGGAGRANALGARPPPMDAAFCPRP